MYDSTFEQTTTVVTSVLQTPFEVDSTINGLSGAKIVYKLHIQKVNLDNYLNTRVGKHVRIAYVCSQKWMEQLRQQHAVESTPHLTVEDDEEVPAEAVILATPEDDPLEGGDLNQKDNPLEGGHQSQAIQQEVQAAPTKPSEPPLKKKR